MNRPDVTLGLIAGGRATRLGGCDKAWLQRDGEALVLSLARRFAPCPVLVSANRSLDRYAGQRLHAVADRIAGAGPLGGIDALLRACGSPWLLTVPVDAIDPPADLLERLRGAAVDGAFAVDADGPQPLFSLWRVAAARPAVSAALAQGHFAVHAVQAMLRMPGVAWHASRFGNLNTPADLEVAGVSAADQDPST